MSARHRQQKDKIRAVEGHIEQIETLIASYAIVAHDLPECDVVAHVMIAMRRQELEIALGQSHMLLSQERQVLASMPKRREVARV